MLEMVPWLLEERGICHGVRQAMWRLTESARVEEVKEELGGPAGSLVKRWGGLVKRCAARRQGKNPRAAMEAHARGGPRGARGDGMWGSGVDLGCCCGDVALDFVVEEAAVSLGRRRLGLIISVRVNVVV